MDNYTDLIKAMADAFITTVRVLETENSRLRSENELLSLELRELREQTDEIYAYDPFTPESYADSYWDTKEGKDV